jgi:putative ABC transport system substrate-binding protein
MRRRDVISLLVGVAVASPLAAHAQPTAKVYRLGFLGVTTAVEFARQADALKSGLRQLGYEEGRNLVIHYRWAEGRYDRLASLAAELVELNVDVIVTYSTPGTLAAKQATSSIPIVMAAVGDPVASGLVDSISRPGGNLTGLTFFFAEIAGKRVELIKDAIPSLTRLAVFVNPANQSHPIALTAMEKAAGAFGVELVPIEIAGQADIADAFTAARARRTSALVTIEDPLLIANAVQIARYAEQKQVPMIGFTPQARAGSLLEYGVDLLDLFSRSATFVDRILKGKSPADIPIERTVKFELIVNLKVAKSLGLQLPTSILVRADHVIE